MSLLCIIWCYYSKMNSCAILRLFLFWPICRCRHIYVTQLILDHFCYAVMSYCRRAAMLLNIYIYFLQFSAQQACERMQIIILCPFEFGFNFLLCVYLPRGWNFRGILNWKPIYRMPACLGLTLCQFTTHVCLHVVMLSYHLPPCLTTS